MNRVFFWGLTFLVLSAIIYLISDTLAPFIIAFIFAYLLQPLIDSHYKKFQLPRVVSTFGVFTIFISGVAIILMLVMPVIYQQFASFVMKIPVYKQKIGGIVTDIIGKVNNIDPEIADKVSDSFSNFINMTFSIFASIANNLWDYTLATINFFTIIALVPVILYYFLRDWPKMISSLESILPKKEKSQVRKIFISINELLSAYIRGQLNICLLLSIYYIIAFSLIGLDLALLFGILAGFLIIIPFFGTVISFLLIMVSCYFTFGYSIKLAYLAILFAFGHIVEGYILTPKIIGNRIGLHPLWILFAVFAAGSLFGFVGILLAIPIAGIIKVLLKVIIDYYKSSNIYKS